MRLSGPGRVVAEKAQGLNTSEVDALKVIISLSLIMVEGYYLEVDMDEMVGKTFSVLARWRIIRYLN